MYHGVHEHRWSIYTDKTIQSGWRRTPRHRYTCEACGREAHLLHRAEEPFYCKCQRLIDIHTSTEVLSPCDTY